MGYFNKIHKNKSKQFNANKPIYKSFDKALSYVIDTVLQAMSGSFKKDRKIYEENNSILQKIFDSNNIKVVSGLSDKEQRKIKDAYNA